VRKVIASANETHYYLQQEHPEQTMAAPDRVATVETCVNKINYN